MQRWFCFLSFTTLSACFLEGPKDEQELSTLLQVWPDGRVPVVLAGGKRAPPAVDSDETQHRREHDPEHVGLPQNRLSSLFRFVHQPHYDEELPLSAKLVNGALLGLYVYAAGLFSRRGFQYREKTQELPEPSNFYVHNFCTAAVSVLALGHLLALLNVPCIFIVPWLYCGRFVAVACWVAGFGHANGADHSEIARAAILAAAAMGQLGASAVFAKYMSDVGVEQSPWPWAFFLTGCIGGVVAQRAVSSMSLNSLSWHAVKIRQKVVTVSECVGCLGACYAMLWVVTEGRPMLSKTAEAILFGIIDTLFVGSNSTILLRAVEQNLDADPKHEVSSGATESGPLAAGPGSTAQSVPEAREGSMG